MTNYPGLFKVVEETAELNEVIGKMLVRPNGDHYVEVKGERVLNDDLHDELADVLAITEYLIKSSPLLDEDRIVSRAHEKLSKYARWVEENGEPLAGP